MAGITLTAALRSEYERLFNTCAVRPNRAAAVNRIVEDIAQDPESRQYKNLEAAMGIPWFFIAAVHQMESDRSFKRHLHNGDSLLRQTVRHPPNRPPHPPPVGGFTWIQSATDALGMKRLGPNTNWSLAGTLYQLERYNGMGYRQKHPHVLSPYLWSFSEHYTRGKYASDGVWSETLVSKQCGAAVILRRMSELGLIEFRDQPAPSPDARPLIPRFSKKQSANPTTVQTAEAMQRWLNSFPGIFVKVDGIPGPLTSDAFRKVTGNFLPGDPRAS